MKYYKLMTFDNKIIGAVSSKNFIRVSPVRGYTHCEPEDGQYISYNGQLYRTTWMAPITVQESYTEVQAIEILEKEYSVYMKALAVNAVIAEEEEEETQEVPEVVDSIARESLEFIRSSKLTEMSAACRSTIEGGFDLELRGETRHFSLDTQDQLNLISLSGMAATQELIPYHADGEVCIFYTAEEINQLVAAATSFKVYHTTYYNALKTYINALDTIEAIAAITYGTLIPDEYKSEVLKVIEQ